MAKSRNQAADMTLTLPGINRPVGRPRTGKALSAAERMRLYRQRRRDSADEFPSRVTENPDDWQVDFSQVDSVTKKHRDRLVDNVQSYQYHRYGNGYQRHHLAFFERDAVVDSLAKLGGLASVW